MHIIKSLSVFCPFFLSRIVELKRRIIFPIEKRIFRNFIRKHDVYLVWPICYVNWKKLHLEIRYLTEGESHIDNFGIKWVVIKKWRHSTGILFLVFPLFYFWFFSQIIFKNKFVTTKSLDFKQILLGLGALIHQLIQLQHLSHSQ